ncbi:MAG TPA: PhnD/SsuA/transferrin family substrate-binding protein [Bdellovibrionota bacterium]|jgi:ABC-type phosphate/phosphonate transport system substrate-binding protein|nr:PhnD/SsuA/transferrin family substrate-binding protein [Bdellovibrionota bacterium]
MKPILLGAVAYDAKVVPIWEGIREHFREQGVPLDFALFSNYERQVDSLLKGHIDIAWNTPLAHVRAQKFSEGRTLSLGMRDSDRDFTARIVVRTDAGIASPKALEGRRLAVGSHDSVQARILPLHWLHAQGVDIGKVNLVQFDSDLGKHGDTGRSELEVLQALAQGQADAGIAGDLVWAQETAAGRVDGSKIRSLTGTAPFDHCMFDGRPGLEADRADAFQKALFAMKWEDPKHRRILEMEGLRQWMPARESGYQDLIAALDRTGEW